MSDFKKSVNDLLPAFLAIAVLMLFVYFQQSQEWNQTLKSRDQKISSLDQKIAELERELVQTRDTIADQEAASKNTAADLKSAREIIGKRESDRQKNHKLIAELQAALKTKDSTGKELAAQENRISELENMVGDQKLQLTQAEETIRRLEESEKTL